MPDYKSIDSNTVEGRRHGGRLPLDRVDAGSIGGFVPHPRFEGGIDCAFTSNFAGADERQTIP